jgi:hypothetical protein
MISKIFCEIERVERIFTLKRLPDTSKVDIMIAVALELMNLQQSANGLAKD